MSLNMSMATTITENTNPGLFSDEIMQEMEPNLSNAPTNFKAEESHVATPKRQASQQFNTANPVSSHVFLLSFFDEILKSKSINRFPDIKEATKRALDLSKTEGFSRERAQLSHNIEVILEPLIACCKSGSQTLALIALNGLSKLISYDYLPSEVMLSSGLKIETKGEKKERSPIEKAVMAICDCFKGENTDDKLQTQIMKALVAAVSSTTTIIHQEALLNAIRTLYNIFLLSRDISNQIVAQGTLIQMSRSVFSRIKPSLKPKTQRTPSVTSFKSNHSGSVINYGSDSEEEDEQDKNKEKLDENKLTLEAIGGKAAEAAANAQVHGNICDSTSDLNVLDGFLLFRALCKLSIKPFRNDATLESRSMALRSKLLSLYLILIIVTEFSDVFITSKVFFLSPGENESNRNVREESFLVAVKPYFGLCLSRNLVSTTPKIFELSLALFEVVMSNLRAHLKGEIEVYLKEIIIPILEMKPNGIQHQKHILFTMFLSKLSIDPQMLVEMYLNYDCDRGSLNNNIFEHLTSSISKLVASVSEQDIEDTPALIWEEQDAFQANAKALNRNDLLNLPSLTADKFTHNYLTNSFFSKASFNPANLQLRALDTLVSILRSLVRWSNKGKSINEVNNEENNNEEIPEESINETINDRETINVSPDYDDPTHFEQNKIHKQALQLAVELFNRKPKKGIESFLKSGIIPNNEPQEIAKFLLESKDINKTMLGEYLGEADIKNIEIMHAFIDLLDFTDLEFVPALRTLLHTFRLPGEAQKIDRFMLKFAERYVEQNTSIFKNADTAYVLAYSVIMLNTDLHNPQVKKRMTQEEFIKNNSGIDDGNDLAQEFLNEIYYQISSKEIKLKDDVDNNDTISRSNTPNTLAAQFDILGNRNKKFNDAQATSLQLQHNAEKILKKMISRKANRNKDSNSVFYSASHYEHIRPMFEVCWMTCLATFSALLKSNDNNKIIAYCLDGFRHAIHIASFFDLELARNTLVNALGNFCFLANIMEMKAKNLEAIRTILDISIEEGNNLKSSWVDILQIVNHLVRLQLIPNFSATTNGRDRSLVAHRDPQAKRFTKLALVESNSQSMLISVDKVFAYSVHLNGSGIVDFVRALSQIAWEELEDIPTTLNKTKAQSSPRMFAIQKLVEVAYYNMNRIRLEWKEIWNIISPLFQKIGCHSNEAVSSYVIDSLRQLATKFLDKEELSHFKFQKEFLSPFVYIMKNTKLLTIKDMVLQCIKQMIKSNSNHIVSGWKTMFLVLGQAAQDESEAIVSLSFELVKKIYTDHFELVITKPENFGSYLICIAQFTKNDHFNKIGLQAFEIYRKTSDSMIQYSKDNPELILNNSFAKESIYSKTQESFPELNFWIPIFHGLLEMVSNVLDLESRTRAIDLLFEYLNQYGTEFPDTFWHYLLDQVLFPIFSSLGDINNNNNNLKFASYEDAIIWASTTLIHALRKFVTLFTDYYDKVFQFLNGLLDLLAVCLCQENPALCKIGSDCFKSLVENNVDRLSDKDWQRIIGITVKLFSASSRVSSDTKQSLTINGKVDAGNQLKEFETIIGQAQIPNLPKTPAQQLNLCLTMISIVEDVFLENDLVFQKIQPQYIFLILDLIERTYLETQSINKEFDIQSAIDRQAVNKLEKFAATSLSLELNCLVGLIKVLLKMYTSDNEEFVPFVNQVEQRIIPLCFDAFKSFNELSDYPLIPGVQNIYELWHEVVLRIGNFLCIANGQQFKAIFQPNSKQIIKCLKHKHLSHEIQEMIFNVMDRVNTVYIENSTNDLSDSNYKIEENLNQSIHVDATSYNPSSNEEFKSPISEEFEDAHETIEYTQEPLNSHMITEDDF